MLNYIKTAFFNPWNLLLIAGGMGLAVYSGYPEFSIPLVIGAEATYIGLLVSTPKFRNYVNAQAAQQKRSRLNRDNRLTLDRIMDGLPRNSLKRYRRLKKRCRKLAAITSKMKMPNDFNLGTTDRLHTRGLDRLLWVFLKLLFARHTLDEFQKEVSEERMIEELDAVEKQLQEISGDSSVESDKIRRTLLDNRATLQERKENYAQAKRDFLFINLELDRVENKIKSISEMSVSRRDPEFIFGQIDTVANSMQETERTMNDLQFISGLGDLEDDIPRLSDFKKQRQFEDR